MFELPLSAAQADAVRAAPIIAAAFRAAVAEGISASGASRALLALAVVEGSKAEGGEAMANALESLAEGLREDGPKPVDIELN